MLINIFDVGDVATRTAKILSHEGHTVRIHQPCVPRNPRFTYHDDPQPVQAVGLSSDELPWLQEELTTALKKNRALWLIASASASVVAQGMLDLCGNSGNIIFCSPPLCGTNKIIGSALTIEHTRQAQQISRIRGNDNSKTYRELVVNHELIDLCVAALASSHYRDNARIRFREATAGGAYLGSSALVAYAEFFGFTRPEGPDYVKLVEDFVRNK